MLVYIEFNLEDKSKNISFEVKKYEIYSKGYKKNSKKKKSKILLNSYIMWKIFFVSNYFL